MSIFPSYKILKKSRNQFDLIIKQQPGHFDKGLSNYMGLERLYFIGDVNEVHSFILDFVIFFSVSWRGWRLCVCLCLCVSQRVRAADLISSSPPGVSMCSIMTLKLHPSSPAIMGFHLNTAHFTSLFSVALTLHLSLADARTLKTHG